MEVTLEGTVTSVRAVLRNAPSPILTMPSSDTDVSAAQPSNAFAGISVTFEGKDMDESFPQALKYAYFLLA